jgi:hypothetical protein
MGNLPLTSAALERLIEDAKQRETECQPYLEHAHALLAPVASTVVEVVREQIAMAGRSDYFLICEVNEVGVRRKLVLWEVKAPQLAPFEVATQNRLSPTRALVEAENQLMYYFDEYRGNAQFLDRYNIRHPGDVQLGGIIIGTNTNWVKRVANCTISDDMIRKMGSTALRIRQEHFYKNQMRILPWDLVATVVKNILEPRRNF